MSNCLKCELTRAKLIAALQKLVGWQPEAIAEFLSKENGENYYVLPNGSIMRASKLPPYEDHEITKGL